MLQEGWKEEEWAEGNQGVAVSRVAAQIVRGCATIQGLCLANRPAR